MWPDPQETADLITSAKEILNGKLHFFVQCMFLIKLIKRNVVLLTNSDATEISPVILKFVVSTKISYLTDLTLTWFNLPIITSGFVCLMPCVSLSYVWLLIRQCYHMMFLIFFYHFHHFFIIPSFLVIWNLFSVAVTIRVVFRCQSKIHDGAFLQEKLTAESR